MTKTPIWPVLLSGGIGARLWPVSRAALPKQLISLTEAATMLQATARRCADRQRYHAPLVVASALHATAISEQLAEIGIEPAALILEPVPRNTAPAIALAALEALRLDPGALLLVMPSDHHIAVPQALQAAVDAARPLAEAGWLVTFGIAPTAPATGYGYIEIGEHLVPGVSKVRKFVEKPDLATAKLWLAQGLHAWNGGIFLFRADALLAALEAHAPLMLASCEAAFAKAARSGVNMVPDAAVFAHCPANSIDYAVLEHAAQVAVVPVSMGWSDIGSWDALRDLGPVDDDENVVRGNVVSVDTRRCLLRSDGPILTTIGVEDLIIVATEDAVLVSAAGQSQAVRGIVDALSGDATLLRPRVELHRWGSLRRLTQGSKAIVCEILLHPGAVWQSPAAQVTIIEGMVHANGRALCDGENATVAAATNFSTSDGARLLVVEVQS